MKLKSIFFLYAGPVLFTACLLPVAIFSYKHPAHNWDMLGYMAVIVRMDKTQDINEVHRITYAEAKENIPAGDYEKLTTAIPFREKFATDPSQFKKLLPIYIVKPLYIWTALAFYRSGFSLPAATVMPSVIAYLLMGVFLFYWLTKYLKPGVAFLGGLLVMLSVFMVAMAGLSTPDCLSALFLFIAVYFILEKKNTTWMFIFFLLSVFTRVDNVITCFFIISSLAFSSGWRRISKLQYLLMCGILAAAYVVIIYPVTEFGWSIFYYSRYARQIDFSRDFSEAVSISSYFGLVYSKLVTALVSSHFTFFLFIGLLLMRGSGFPLRKLNPDQSLLLLLLAITAFRFVLLPDLSDRFYIGFYLVTIILLVRKFSTKKSTPGDEDREHKLYEHS